MKKKNPRQDSKYANQTFQCNQFALNNNPDRSNCNVGNEIINNNEINSEKIIFKKVRNKNITLRAGLEPAREDPK